MFKKLIKFLFGKKKEISLDKYEEELDNELIRMLDSREQILQESLKQISKKEKSKKETKKVPNMSGTKKKKPKEKKEIKLTPEEETKIVSNLKKKGIYSEPTKKKPKK